MREARGEILGDGVCGVTAKFRRQPGQEKKSGAVAREKVGYVAVLIRGPPCLKYARASLKQNKLRRFEQVCCDSFLHCSHPFSQFQSRCRHRLALACRLHILAFCFVALHVVKSSSTSISACSKLCSALTWTVHAGEASSIGGGLK